MLQMIHVLLNSPSGISIGHSDMSYACIFSSNRLRSRPNSRKCYQHLSKVSWQCSAAHTLMVAYCICWCEEPSRLSVFCICILGGIRYQTQWRPGSVQFCVRIYIMVLLFGNKCRVQGLSRREHFRNGAWNATVLDTLSQSREPDPLPQKKGRVW